MKRLAAALDVVLSLAGCGSFFGIPLVTGDPLEGGCFTASGFGRLVVDPRYGTAIIGEGGGGQIGLPDHPTPVAWRPGYTAQRVGSEVQVRDPRGTVVATTGERYEIFGAVLAPGDSDWRDLPTTMFWACSDPL